MLFRQIFDEKLAQYAYLIGCQQTGEALILDPERDVDRYVEMAREEGLEITAVAETHIHADFLSGARELAMRYGARVYVSDEGDADWKYEWVREGEVDHVLLKDGDTFRVGNIELEAIHTPGHTPEHMAFLVTDHGGGADEPMGVASGDFVFVGALGRPDLLETAAHVEGAMEPSARRLYASVQRFLELPDYLQVWPAHGAGSACGKALGAVPESTVGYERRFSPALDFARRGEDAFVSYILEGQPEPPLYFARMKRDNKLGAPVLGELPAPRRLGPEDLGALLDRHDLAVIDTRVDRSAFMAAHLPGSLYAPLTKAFNTAVGSIITDETTPIHLIVEQDRLDEAVRDLVRIGFDRIEGYATPDTLAAWFEVGGPTARIDEIDFAAAGAALAAGEGRMLDVRYASEYGAGHVPGAINASYTRLPEYLDRLPVDETLLVHCQSGARAAVAASYLARTGRTVRYVNDHWTTWASSAPVEKGDAVAA